ncbi:MAG: peptidyl-prolyl cis-trans isomerase SurA [Bradyrhizobium sp.]|jgi:peptidyl-prolyl cis-trans isomerase SurA|nr:peptidyl-prolyl cis-trans isomerase SurA [Bradyrhizobium sp.]
MTVFFLSRLSRLILSGAAALILIGSASQLHAQSVVVMVNGEPITNYDIEQRSKLNTLSHKAATRQQVIEELIDEKVKIKEAKRFGVDPTSSDIDAAFGQMSTRMHLTTDQLTKMLEAQSIRPETLKARIKADMVWGSLVRGRFKESLQIGEKDVAAAAQVNMDDKDKPQTESFEYQMRPIVLIVPRGAPAATMETRRKEAEALRARVQTCEEANALFRSMQNATIRDTVVKTSADLPAPLRELLDKTPVGHLTAPETTKQGIEMVALCGRKPTTIDTPKKREVREKMYLEKYEKKQKAYLDEVRKAAMIEYR